MACRSQEEGAEGGSDRPIRNTKQAERAIIAGLEELGWAAKVGLAELDGVHGKVNVALKRLITAGKVVRAKAGIADYPDSSLIVGINDRLPQVIYLLGVHSAPLQCCSYYDIQKEEAAATA